MLDRTLRSLIRRFLIAAALLGAGASVLANDCLPLLTSAVVRQLGTRADDVFRLADEGGRVSQGLAAALKSRMSAGDAGARVADIMERFPTSAGDVFSSLASVQHAKGLDELVVRLGMSAENAKGAAATLRYSVTRMDPKTVAEFEVPIGIQRLDMSDVAGNLFEFKAVDYSNLPDFIARKAFEDVRSQITGYQQAAAAAGKEFTLVFENPTPDALRSTFEAVFGEFRSLPNVRIVEGF